MTDKTSGPVDMDRTKEMEEERLRHRLMAAEREWSSSGPGAASWGWASWWPWCCRWWRS
jgi:hypothetical protein